MKWLILGGLGVAALVSMKGRAYPEPPEALPAPPITTAGKQVKIVTPEGEEWEATLLGSYYQVID